LRSYLKININKKVLSKMKNFNRSNFPINLMLLACLSIFLFSCCKKDDPPPVIPLEISQDIKDLIYFKGDEKASAVLINAQSGPDTLLSTGEVDQIFNDYGATDLLIVNVHQAQTLNPGILHGNDMTLGEAVNFNAESIETLYQVIEYFKEQGRTVYVLGASFGAFISQELIAKKGIDAADKYLIMIGRLDMNDIMWQGLAEGRYGYFEDGITPILDSEPTTDVIDRNLGKIAAGLGMNRYTQRFAAIEDLSKVTYIYGSTDHLVGRLTAEEVAFLESKNANIIAGSGGHDDTYEDFLTQGLNEAFGIE